MSEDAAGSTMGDELIYAYENSKNPAETVYEQAASQGCRGILIDAGDRYALSDPRLDRLKALCRKAGMELILSLRCNPAAPDEREIGRALEITPLIGLGDLKAGEFHGEPGLATAYRDLAKEMAFTWVCLLTHPRIILDIAGSGKIRDEIGDALCFCMTGHVLAGYLYADSRVEWDERLNGRPNTPTYGKDLASEYGVTIATTQEYLRPLKIVSGVGHQHGLDNGMRIYLRQLGFKGIIVGLPFDLDGSLKARTLAKPDSYPTGCSRFDTGYR